MTLLQYFAGKENKKLDLTKWSFNAHKDIPQQDNTIDCGVFVLAAVKYHLLGNIFDFSAKDIPFIRMAISYELITATKQFGKF
jgi:Ulp1 family protease